VVVDGGLLAQKGLGRLLHRGGTRCRWDAHRQRQRINAARRTGGQQQHQAGRRASEQRTAAAGCCRAGRAADRSMYGAQSRLRLGYGWRVEFATDVVVLVVGVVVETKVDGWMCTCGATWGHGLHPPSQMESGCSPVSGPFAPPACFGASATIRPNPRSLEPRNQRLQSRALFHPHHSVSPEPALHRPSAL
jgi:hypothetical protein